MVYGRLKFYDLRLILVRFGISLLKTLWGVGTGDGVGWLVGFWLVGWQGHGEWSLESVLLQVSSVHGQMTSQLIRACESLGAVGPGADMGLLTSVSAHVGFEVVRARELPLADVALEGADSCVLPAVTPQLVRPGEPLAAALVVADVGLLPRVLADVHLEVRELQVPLGAAGVEADEWLPLLLRLDVLLLSDEAAGLCVSAHLGQDKGGVAGHGHLEWGGTLVDVGISRNCRGDDFKGEGHRLGLDLVSWNDVGAGEGEDGVATARADHGGTTGGVLRVVLQRDGAAGGDDDIGDGGLDGGGEVRVLGVLLGLVGPHHGLLGTHGLHVVHGRVGWGVAGGLLMIGDRWAGVDGGGGGGVGRGGKLFVLQGHRGLHVEKLGTGIIHEASIW